MNWYFVRLLIYMEKKTTPHSLPTVALRVSAHKENNIDTRTLAFNLAEYVLGRKEGCTAVELMIKYVDFFFGPEDKRPSPPKRSESQAFLHNESADTLLGSRGMVEEPRAETPVL